MDAVQKFTIILLFTPDERLILQRRTNDAQYAPGMLGFFGGWVENDETPLACVKREIIEETSLNPEDLNIEFVRDYIVPSSHDYAQRRHFYLYRSNLGVVPNFKVFEGDRAESIRLEELKTRSDLTSSARYTIEHFFN